MKYTAFHAQQFRTEVDNALLSVQQILDTNRMPRYAQDTPHTYDDKYALATYMTNTAMSCTMNALERMGLTKGKLATLQEWVQVDKKTVTLRLEFSDSCHFLKELAVSVPTMEGDSVIETQTTSYFGGTTTKKEQSKYSIKTVVKEYHWKVGINYRIYAYYGNDSAGTNVIELQSRSSSSIIITKGKNKAPFPEITNHPPIETFLTWMLQRISMDKLVCGFSINASKPTCKTPVQNDDIKAAFAFFTGIRNWARSCAQLFCTRIDFEIMTTHAPASEGTAQSRTQDLQSISSFPIFCPILPLMETPRDLTGSAAHHEHPKSLLVLTLPTSSSTPSPLLSVGDMDKFLNEHIRTLDEQLALLQSSFPPHQLVKLVTVAEAGLVLLWNHLADLARHHENGIGYIEDMLKKQLIAAIGKEVHQQDFDQFMSFHNQKFFAPNYAPKPLCYAIGRPNHYPDGILAIERNSTFNDTIQPIETLVRMIDGDSVPPLFIPINAATSIEMTGHRYLHGWLQHRFTSSSCGPSQFSLTARARQFSSFLLMIGVMAGPDKFNPKNAIILQNKDELLIPLLLNELPTAKEFKDAIVSLSPEQQQFATAFRGMQLESSVFGVCVVQLKPQLELLLGLPEGSLTKEIRLTQDLMSLFVDYQIPSDLLSFDGDVTTPDKVGLVKDHVKAVLDVIVDAKARQLEEEKMQAAMNVETLRRERTSERFDMVATSFGAPDRGTPIGYSEDISGIVMGAVAPELRGVKRSMNVPTARMKSEIQMAQAARVAPAPPSPMPLSTPDFQTPTTLDFTSDLGVGVLDFTMIPRQLDAKFDKYDTDNSLRATIMEVGKDWTRKRQENLLTKPRTAPLVDIKGEQSKAFDLLDALSRSGTLPIACAELHVIIAVTHCFENDVMGTVIQDNVNPIAKVEKSALMIASTIHGNSVSELMINQSDSERLSITFPELFETE